MCTVVAKWTPGESTPVHMLALRDEFAGRDFDLPAAWWDGQPNAVGGHDRRAGGTWCASDVVTGSTAVVLNRPEPRQAGPGAASRGVLPLLALRHGDTWSEHIDLMPMAGFNLVLLTPTSASWWVWNGSLSREDLGPGTYQFKPDGRTVEVPARLLAEPGPSPLDADGSTAEQFWGDWIGAVRGARPTDDGSGLLVRRTIGDDSYETVFGQLIAARPGLLRLDYRARVAREDGPWTTRIMDGHPGSSQPGSRAQRWVS